MNIFFEKLRYYLFWTLDFIKGRNIEKHIRDIDYIIKNYHQKETKDLIEKRLQKLLKHSIETTLFYKDIDKIEIKEFPVINKNIIRERLEEFISTNYSKNLLSRVVTSGSTGTPFAVFQDKNKRLRNTADTIYFARLAGFELGQRLYYFKIWNDLNKKGRFVAWFQNVIPQNVFDLSTSSILKLIENIRKDKSTLGFLGYASAFEAICKVIEVESLDQIKINVKSIIAMSEGLNKYTKTALKKYFHAPVVSRYSNVENGIIAQQSIEGNDEFYLNFASYYIELLNIDDDTYAPFKSIGRIIITDLYNYGMPLIRYDTGDIGVISEIKVNGVNTPVLTKVEGRRMDMVFNTKGDLVSSFTITNNMWKYSNIKQYQFIQLSKDSYLFKINPGKNFNEEKELVDEFKNYFGLDAKIGIEYVDEIPLLSSGKRKKVVNKIYNK